MTRFHSFSAAGAMNLFRRCWSWRRRTATDITVISPNRGLWTSSARLSYRSHQDPRTEARTNGGEDFG
jgi:hypothetical protein